jgi:hypothetical protein
MTVYRRRGDVQVLGGPSKGASDRDFVKTPDRRRIKDIPGDPIRHSALLCHIRDDALILRTLK